VGGTLAAFVGIRYVFLWTGILTLLASGWAAFVIRHHDTE
jgi:hypothetical protein